MKFVITDKRSIIKQVVSGIMIFIFILSYIVGLIIAYLTTCAILTALTQKGVIIFFSIIFLVAFAMFGNDIWKWSNKVDKHLNKKVK